MPERLKSLLVLLNGLFFATSLWAGEMQLIKQQLSGCEFSLVHHQTEGFESATLVFRATQLETGIVNACSVSPEDAERSLIEGLQQLNQFNGLKPVSSLFIGRLVRYPWMVEHLAKRTEPLKRSNGFGEFILTPEMTGPFTRALRLAGFDVVAAQCEKRMFDSKGRLIDALCWIEVKSSE